MIYPSRCLKCGAELLLVGLAEPKPESAFTVGIRASLAHSELMCEHWKDASTRLQCVTMTKPESEPIDYRKRVVEIALSHVGKSDPTPYWVDVLPPSDGKHPSNFPRNYCGAFYLSMLREAGLARNVYWRRGWGLEGAFSLYRMPFPLTDDPQPGDMAYVKKDQHHAMVEKVTGGLVSLINGNGSGRKVTHTVASRSSIHCFYSIQGLIDIAQ